MSKKLYRSTENRVFLGVCGGLGEYFDIDPVVIRVVWLLLFGISIITYFILALIIPEKPYDFY